MRTKEQIQSEVLGLLGPHYAPYAEAAHQAALDKNVDQLHEAIKIFYNALSDEEKEDNFLSPMRWVVSPINRLLSEKKHDECIWLLRNGGRLDDAIKSAAFYGDFEFLELLIENLNIKTTNIGYWTGGHCDQWNDAFFGAAIGGGKPYIEKLDQRRNQIRGSHKIEDAIEKIIYASAILGDFKYCNELLKNPEHYRSAADGAIVGGYVTQAHKWIEKIDPQIELPGRTARNAGRKELAEELLTLNFIISLHNKTNNTSNRPVTTPKNALTLPRKLPYRNLSPMEKFNIISNNGELFFLACLSSNTRNVDQSKKRNVRSIFPWEIWLTILNFVFGLNEKTSHKRLTHISRCTAQIMRPTVFAKPIPLLTTKTGEDNAHTRTNTI